MDNFPLQEELIDAVVGFANSKIKRPEQVFEHFAGTWQPESLPKLRTCRRIQQEVRNWMLDKDVSFVLALEGYSWGPLGQVDKGIRLVGEVHTAFDLDKESCEVDLYLTWKWSVSHASLRAICGLAVATIFQRKLHRRLGLCQRVECNNIFIDLTSRGTPRKYCKTDECERARNREAVKKSRKGKQMRNLKGRKK